MSSLSSAVSPADPAVTVSSAAGAESCKDSEAPLTDDERELLELYRAADAGTQKAAASALKGEAQQSQDPMSAMMSMFGGMMGGAAPAGEQTEAPADAPAEEPKTEE